MKNLKINLKISDRTVTFERRSGEFEIEVVPYQMNGKKITVVCVGKLEDDSTIKNSCEGSFAYSWFTCGHEDTPKFKTWKEVIDYKSCPESEYCPHYLEVIEGINS
tara:strand:- start:3369 stop:3686 length:318 start_codon:yes stop_codon:yes gene_type:complete